ncbi:MULTISPECIES: CU044_5270 family protein [Streptomyces]|uniref:CU044_5270 family protein n=1 Tax=Streptomyces TaxID=1883 RepID=UPI00226D7CB8|nr:MULTISPECIES: CU044_5270 family protein [unclassified Streptomyces]MCY0947751.1 CU044_5270 family protein [Streptomyces sp. H34-AA3]MCY0955179.1 CU044_5270 family protein [Streptomyces sp. H27-S2]MCZ4088066.1 CU044_5270 family protein [Streptomyces sp. H34-S5]
MNADDDARTAPSGHDELLQRLPGLSDAELHAELPFSGHHLRELLMRETARGTRAASRRPGRPLVLSLAAAAAACAVAVAFALGGHGPVDRPGAAAPEPAAVRLLDRVALAAATAPAPAVRDGQFMYTKTIGHSTSLTEVRIGQMVAAPTDQSAERWLPVDGSAGTVVRTASGTDRIPPGGPPSLSRPTYRFLETVPTDPAELLELLYKDARAHHGPGSGSTTGPDQQAFVAIGDLLRSVETPPGLSAALYRAAARIPGVVVVPEASDAAGRTGVAVARVHDGERTEWIFDKESLRLLGSREVVLEDNSWGKAGTVVTSVAVVARGVTDRPGQLPGS